MTLRIAVDPFVRMPSAITVTRTWLTEIMHELNAISEDANLVAYVVSSVQEVPSVSGTLLRLADRADTLEHQIVHELGKVPEGSEAAQ
jgi:hypothetical protein